MKQAEADVTASKLAINAAKTVLRRMAKILFSGANAIWGASAPWLLPVSRNAVFW
jgi:hypothetical protein